MPLHDVPWIQPVTIRLQCGLERTFTGAYDALAFLKNEWPLRNGERHERAVKTCRGALSGVVPTVIAREAFIAACFKVGVPTVTTPKKTMPKPRPMRAPRGVDLDLSLLGPPHLEAGDRQRPQRRPWSYLHRWMANRSSRQRHCVTPQPV